MVQFLEGKTVQLRKSEIEVLTKLGLSVLQAKVFLALTHLGSAEAKTISKLSKVARSDIYRTLASLQERGMVEKIIAKPLKFKAINMEKALILLLESVTEKHKKIELSTKQLLHRYKEKQLDVQPEKESHQYILIPGKRLVIDRIRAAIERVRISCDVRLSLKRFAAGIDDVFAESFKKATDKNVKFRFIIEAPEGAVAENIRQFCIEQSNCQFRFIPNPPEAVFGIYDKKEAFIVANPTAGLTEAPALWTDNSSMISIIQNQFEHLWLKAKTYDEIVSL